MEVRSAEGQDASDRIRIMKTLIIDEQAYDYGKVSQICYWLGDLHPEQTSRITTDPVVRRLLLNRKVIASTGAYPLESAWARFRRGETFEAFYRDLQEAEDALRGREPLRSDEKPLTGWLAGGPVWGIDASGFLAAEDEGPQDLAVLLGDEEGQLWLNLGDGEEAYPIELTPDQAEALGAHLHKLARALVEGSAPDERASFDTQMETIYLSAVEDGSAVDLSGDDWGGEESGVRLTPAQADEVSWQLRETAAVSSRTGTRQR